MPAATPFRIKSITDIHRLMGLPKPNHPLIEIIDLKDLRDAAPEVDAVVFDLYVISLKRGCDKLIYGQQKYDFDEGLMAFMAPGQILRGEENGVPQALEGFMMFIHPDFLWNTPLARKVRKYDFFDYAVNEALFLSDKEEKIINEIVANIKNEYNSNIDKFSQDIIISHLETLLNYADRFYQRQFITRKPANNTVLEKLESVVDQYFEEGHLATKGLPSVAFISQELHISPGYLRSLLKTTTGQSTQHYIHERLIGRAKELLSTTSMSISEIAYELGFEHLQSFSKLFKTKTMQSPMQFRQSFL